MGILPIKMATKGTRAILGITDNIMRTIANNPKPNHDIAAISRKRFTYFSGVTIRTDFYKKLFCVG